MIKTSRPTKAEQETILLTSEADKLVSIYTFNRRLIRRLEAYSRKYPHLCQLKQTHTNGAVTYEIVKSRISLRLLSPTSEEHKAQLRKQLAEQELQEELTDSPEADEDCVLE